MCAVHALQDKSKSKRFTKSEISRLVSDRNFYKERLLELQDAVKLTETLRASQRGHPELLKEFPTVSNVQRIEHSSDSSNQPTNALTSAFTRL